MVGDLLSSFFITRECDEEHCLTLDRKERPRGVLEHGNFRGVVGGEKNSILCTCYVITVVAIARSDARSGAYLPSFHGILSPKKVTASSVS